MLGKRSQNRVVSWDACFYVYSLNLQEMTLEERQLITDLNKCDFRELHAMHIQRVEARKNMSKEEKQVSVLDFQCKEYSLISSLCTNQTNILCVQKCTCPSECLIDFSLAFVNANNFYLCLFLLLNVLQVIKEANQKIVEEYGFCVLDHHRERIGNFKIEPPALFRGRGDHPKQGMLKKRIQPEDVIINCSKWDFITAHVSTATLSGPLYSVVLLSSTMQRIQGCIADVFIRYFI